MAVGNALVTTAKFKPLSYKEWAAPLEEISTQHAAEETALEALTEGANKYERYIRANPNSEVALQYKNYLAKLENEADMLSRYGMSPDRRASLISLRREYNRQVKPIRAAVETLDDIEKQYMKDSKKIVIGAPEIDVNYLLEHPDYTAADYKKSYILGEDVLKYSSNLFKGLTGWDTTPRTETSSDGSYAYIITPQGYTTEDYITALTGQGNGRVTPELEKAIKTARDNFNYDNLDEISKEQIDRILLSAASKHTKEAKISVRNAPKGKVITPAGTIQSKYKGYTPLEIDGGETVYKKGSQYYRITEDNNGNVAITPITEDITIGGRTFKQKSEGAAGTLVAEKSTGTESGSSSGTTSSTTTTTPQLNNVYTGNNEGSDW